MLLCPVLLSPSFPPLPSCSGWSRWDLIWDLGSLAAITGCRVQAADQLPHTQGNSTAAAEMKPRVFQKGPTSHSDVVCQYF